MCRLLVTVLIGIVALMATGCAGDQQDMIRDADRDSLFGVPPPTIHRTIID